MAEKLTADERKQRRIRRVRSYCKNFLCLKATNKDLDECEKLINQVSKKISK